MADAEHRRIFNERLAETLDDPERRMNSPFLNTEQYDAILATVRDWGALTREERKALGSKAYAWVKKYTVITAGGETQLVFAKDKAAADGATDPPAQDLVPPVPNAAGAATRFQIVLLIVSNCFINPLTV